MNSQVSTKKGVWECQGRPTKNCFQMCSVCPDAPQDRGMVSIAIQEHHEMLLQQDAQGVEAEVPFQPFQHIEHVEEIGDLEAEQKAASEWRPAVEAADAEAPPLVCPPPVHT